MDDTDDETFVRSFQEEEFLAEFGHTPVLAAVLKALEPAVWEPNPLCNDDVRRQQKLETDPVRLARPVYSRGSTYSTNGKIAAFFAVFASAGHESAIKVKLNTGRWETVREDRPLWRIDWLGIDSELKEKILGELKELEIEAEPQEPLMFSSSLPTFIEVVANLETWKVLLAAGAAVYAKKFVETLASDHAATRKKVYASVWKAVSGSAQKLQRFVKILRDNCKTNSESVRVSIKFPMEGVIFDLPLDDEDEAIATLARMTNCLGMVSAATAELKDRIACNMPAEVTLDDNGFTLTWYDKIIYAAVEQKFGADGKPIGEPRRLTKA